MGVVCPVSFCCIQYVTLIFSSRKCILGKSLNLYPFLLVPLNSIATT